MKNRKSIGLIVGISIVVGFLHFIIGPDYQGPFRKFIAGYLIDILLPLNVYLLGQISLRKSLSLKYSRLLAAIGTLVIGIAVESMQYSGIHILGTTFDPWDILMYAIGVGLGWAIDMTILDSWEKT